MPLYRFIFIALVAWALVSPAPLRAVRLAGSTLKPVQFPFHAQVVPPSSFVDFDRDGKLEELSVLDGRAVLHSPNRQTRWQSPSTWEVRQAQIADLNRDGLPEAVLLVWRPFKPWPVDAWLPHGGRIENFHDSAGRSCHLILIGWEQGAFRERWAGSALAEPVKAFAAAELAGDGKQFLVTLEISYDESLSAPARKLKVWEWNGFGFTVVSQMTGPFNQLSIARDLQGQWLMLAP